MMQSFTSSDGLTLRYLDSAIKDGGVEKEEREKPWVILIHGFTGTHRVWSRNIDSLSRHYRVIASDLRGHGESQTPAEPFTVENSGVERLAKDLRDLVTHLSGAKNVDDFRFRVVGGSLGCAIIWSYAHLFTTQTITHAIFVDQSPLQNELPDWQPPFCHNGLRTASDFANFEKQITTDPVAAHLGTIHSCLGYLSHPSPSYDQSKDPKYIEDKDFFLGEALKGKGEFYAKLMEDHTALDHRANIKTSFGPGSGSESQILVIASAKSGCFNPDGPMAVVNFVNGEVAAGKLLAKGEVVEWGGHWCYWEDPERFDELVLDFLKS